ncbi:MAG: hypothetical protein ACE5QV_02595 [Fidelibacterota bacterium]
MRPSFIILLSSIIELRGFSHKFRDLKRSGDPGKPKYYTRKFQNVEVFVVKTGIGIKNAEQSAQKVVESLPCQGVINCGAVGALNRKLKVGDIFIPLELHSVLDPEVPIFVENQLLSEIVSFFEQMRLRYFTGCILTVTRHVGSKKRGNALKRSSGADAVDMEAYPVAKVCAERGIPFVSLKVVSDYAESWVEIHYFLNVNRAMNRAGGILFQFFQEVYGR